MDRQTDLAQIGSDDFARRFAMRAKKLMWFLGAGASASAGIPTASDMIWDFKQRLFISQRRVSHQAVADLSNPVIRAQLQDHIESSASLPPPGDPDEYAALFEAVYPAEADRRAYLDAKIAGGKPSYGHLALAALMQARLTSLVWTTNFDPLVADACAKVFGATGPLTTVDLGEPELAEQVVSEERWPVEIKLHGDFRSRRLKNTTEELRHQDTRLRRVLVETCRRYGLVVVGYSGRDGSIMKALEEVLATAGAFPAGLFWLHRGDGQPLARVRQLIARALEMQVEAAFVQVENFDEALRDSVRLIDNVDHDMLRASVTDRRHWSAAPAPTGRRGWPVVRVNALPVIQMPTVCRRIVCSVGGHAEAREAIKEAGVDVLVSRTRAGVLVYGADTDVRAAFEAYRVTDFDLHTIETRRLRYESGERGLLRDALSRALCRRHGLDLIRRRNSDLLAPSDPAADVWGPLHRLVGTLSGTAEGHPELRWCEGIGVRIDWADERLWLLVEPRTVFTGVDESNRAVAADLARERSVKRYNRQLNHLIDFWAHLLAADGGEMHALGVSDGVDATFRLSADTGFSWRARA